MNVTPELQHAYQEPPSGEVRRWDLFFKSIGVKSYLYDHSWPLDKVFIAVNTSLTVMGKIADFYLPDFDCLFFASPTANTGELSKFVRSINTDGLPGFIIGTPCGIEVVTEGNAPKRIIQPEERERTFFLLCDCGHVVIANDNYDTMKDRAGCCDDHCRSNVVVPSETGYSYLMDMMESNKPIRMEQEK